MIAIVSAVREELAEYLAIGGFARAGTSGSVRLYRSAKQGSVVVAESGIGGKRAEEATRLIVDRFKPALIVSAGFGGAVQPGLATADVVLCERVWWANGPLDSWSPDTAELCDIGNGTVGDLHQLASRSLGRELIRGDCLTVPRVFGNPSEKQRVGGKFDVSVLDMESYWVCRAAGDYGVPCLVLRSVLDTVDQRLPAFVEVAAANGGDRRRRRAMGHALSRPWEIPGLIRLASQARAASASLASVLMVLASRFRPSLIPTSGPSPYTKLEVGPGHTG